MLEGIRRLFEPTYQEKDIAEILAHSEFIGDGPDSTVRRSGKLALHIYKPRIKYKYIEFLKHSTNRAAKLAQALDYSLKNKPLRVHVVAVDQLVTYQEKHITFSRFISYPRVSSMIGQGPLHIKSDQVFLDLLDKVTEGLQHLTGHRYIEIVPMNVRYNASQNELWITDLYSGVMNLRYYSPDDE